MLVDAERALQPHRRFDPRPRHLPSRRFNGPGALRSTAFVCAPSDTSAASARAIGAARREDGGGATNSAARGESRRNDGNLPLPVTFT
jgi:hypothetical protein